MRLSVIVPVHNGEADLRKCLQALQASTRPADEILVVDDASTDRSAEVARSLGAVVVAAGKNGSGKPQGPAVARNRGAKVASGDILVFFDADVQVHADTLAKIEACFEDRAQVAALFGSYDDSPPAPGVISQYKNLLHHYVHQNSKQDAWTFWTGCGAVRREVFLQLGGFDEYYALPSIEDIAFGRRLREAGHAIRLCPEVQVTHLKKWTLRSWLRTDIFQRAVPWTQLLLQDKKALPNDLNLDWKSRMSALAAWVMVFCLLAAWSSPHALIGAGMALAVVLFCNFPLLQFFMRRRGIGFGIGALGCHMLYYLYSSFTFACLVIPHKFRGRTLMVLLLATLLKGIVWSLVIPAWQASDEPQHYFYGQGVLQGHTLQVAPSRQVPLEAWWLGAAVQAARLKHQPQNSIDFSRPEETKRQIAASDASAGSRELRDDHWLMLGQPGFNNYHPPLYYAALAVVQAPLQAAPLRWRLLACRWFSVLLGLLVVLSAYYVGREVWPRRPQASLLLGTIVSFQPMLTFSTATVTNSAQEIALFSVVIMLAVKAIYRGMKRWDYVLLGVVAGLGLITKLSFVAVLPALAALLWFYIPRVARGRKGRSLIGWIGAAAIALTLSGWWYRTTFLGGSDLLMQSFGNPVTSTTAPAENTSNKVVPQSAPPSSSKLQQKYTAREIFKAIATSQVRQYAKVFVSYWANFGWPDTHFPLALYPPLAAVVVAAYLRVGIQVGRLRRQWKRARRSKADFPDGDASRITALRWMAATSWWMIAFYLVVDFRTMLRLGGNFGLRGQYYLPIVIGQMAWLMPGLQPWRRSSTEDTSTNENASPLNLNSLTAAWLPAAVMVVFNFVCLFGLIMPRYYGAVGLTESIRRIAILQPVPSSLIWLLIFAYTVATLALVICSNPLHTQTKHSVLSENTESIPESDFVSESVSLLQRMTPTR